MLIQAVKANGELIDNSQAAFMMKLTLSIIWISVIQKSVLSLPIFQSQNSSNNESEGKDEVHIVQTKAEEYYVNMRKSQGIVNSINKYFASLFSKRETPDELEKNHLIIE